MSLYNQPLKTVVFDLDGTLYDDTRHFAYYAERIKSRLPKALQAQFADEYCQILKGKHSLKVGRIYDKAKDIIILQLQNQVIEAFTWDGVSIDAQLLQSLFPNPVTIDQEHFYSIGDLWGVPAGLARHYGLKREHLYPAFLETREYMMSPGFTLRQVPDFGEALAALRKQKKLALLTNSPQPDSETILRKLGMDDLFDIKVFNGRKPVQTKARFAEIREALTTEYRHMLSIGDNYVNEILPAKELGMATIYIDSHGTGFRAGVDLAVESIEQLVPHLQRLALSPANS